MADNGEKLFSRVIVIGCSGAGKSTFSRALAEKTKLPIFHLDNLFWNIDKTTVLPEEFDLKLAEVLEQESWIIDGNFKRTLEMRLQKCDRIYLLDYPLDVCLAGVQQRIGKKRVDLPWIEEEFDSEFKQYIIDFEKTQLPDVYELVEKYNDIPCTIFHSRQEATQYLENFCFK